MNLHPPYCYNEAQSIIEKKLGTRFERAIAQLTIWDVHEEMCSNDPEYDNDIRIQYNQDCKTKH